MEQLSADKVKEIVDSVTSSGIHLMVDLETLSTKPTAAIRELGWAFFDMDHAPGTMLSSGSVYIDPQPMLNSPNFHTDWETIRWWMLNEERARADFANPTKVPLDEALKFFSDEVIKPRPEPIIGVWSHGASFDMPILHNAYDFVGIDLPWSYRIIRDTRTIFDFGKPLTAINPISHSALHDAVAQATEIQAAVQAITRKFKS